jgi:isochorismate synthase
MAFVSFRLPGAKKIEHIVGTASRNMDDAETAFVFGPFEPTQKPYYIKAKSFSSVKTTIPPSLGSREQKSTTKTEFTGLVNRVKTAIESGEFSKVVTARILALDRPEGFDPVALFRRLCSEYQSAFVSLTYIPGVGLWIGASPEVLVSETPQKLVTWSLAGTKVATDDTSWTEKEKREQKIVTDFIHKKLRRSIGGKIGIKGPVEHKAGRVKHLLSVFTILHQQQGIWAEVVRALHPTPAVSGMPQHGAIQFAKREESFNRGFYAGYLGPVGRKGKTDIFVNLRCMKVTANQLLLYAGCGVTSDSDPEREWQETEEKMKVLKSLIYTERTIKQNR